MSNLYVAAKEQQKTIDRLHHDIVDNAMQRNFPAKVYFNELEDDDLGDEEELDGTDDPDDFDEPLDFSGASEVGDR